MTPCLGIDFDNTLVSYDRLLDRLAAEQGLPADVRGKRAIRDALRASPEGDIAWQKVQGQLYGPRMAEADLMPGADAFLLRCREAGVRVCIVSHKTEYAGYDPTRTPLRDAARAWMGKQGFFHRFGIAPGDVHFEGTRAAKVARIATVGPAVFIDDLEEVFTEPGFPAAVAAHLFHPGPEAPRGPWRVVRSYADLEGMLFPFPPPLEGAVP